jgi:hypothetical protein
MYNYLFVGLIGFAHMVTIAWIDGLVKLLARVGAPALLSEGFMSRLAETSTDCAPNPSFPQRKISFITTLCARAFP